MRLATWTLIGGMGLLTLSGNAQAINVQIDYTYDISNFFGSGNPDGAAAGQMARDALDAAAAYYSQILTDTFSEVSTPPIYYSQFFNGQVVWEWTLNFPHPATGSNIQLVDQTIPEDQYIIYAGARSLGGLTLGEGGPGGWGWSRTPSGVFTQAEIDEINLIDAAFVDAVETRGETSGFANWGGAITFDSDASTTWWYDHTTEPTGAYSDFFSVALHELAHSLGFGSSDEWTALVSGSTFFGSAAQAEHGSYPTLSTDKAHWINGTTSTIYGDTLSQEAAMDPSLTEGDRKLFTALDAAGLTDIGWSVVPPVISLEGDLNGDGFVGLDDLDIVLNNWNQTVPPADSAADPSGDGYVGLDDLDIVLNHWNEGTPPSVAVPEPASLALLALACTALLRRRS